MKSKHGLPRDTACRIRKNTSFPTQFKPPEAIPLLEMSSQLQHNQPAKQAQPSCPTMPMAPCTLTDLIAPRTHILAGTSITPEKESLLNRGGVPENDDNRRKCGMVEEPLISSSSLDMDPSLSRCISTTNVTAMMI